jgi:ammonia channel protein AmtB
MVSRDSKVQVAVVAITMAIATLWVRFGTPDAITSGLFVVACYVLLFAGSHVYLALRDDGEDVPVAARWRFAGVVSFAVVALLLGNAVSRVELGGVALSTAVWALVAVVFLAYLAYEARDGYRSSRQP